MDTIDNIEIKPITLPNPHFVFASEKLFNAPIGNNFVNEFKDGHFIALMDYHDRSTMSPQELKAKTKEYFYKLSIHWQVNYHTRVFIGLGQDSLYLFNLYTDHGIVFDAAVLINFDFSVLRNNEIITKGIKDHTKIYNFYNNNKKYTDNDLAHVNQYIPTRLSPALSKRFALETNGVLVNEVYQMLYMQPNSPSQYRMIDHKLSVVGN